MVAIPAEIPVTIPEVFTVATAMLLEDQVPPVVASPSAVVDPTQTELIPVIAATTGNAFTVTVAVALAVQPDPLVTA
jgi:hypothetical protein